MVYWDSDSENFYKFAMTLFSETGHTSASEPKFLNHSAECFVYFDVTKDVSFTADQRKLLNDFDNVSKLFTENDCDFFSLNLLTSKSDRSQVAHNIHTVLHPLLQAEASICLFRWEESVMLTFVGFGKKCILSDWYQIYQDYDVLKNKLDIGNMSIRNSRDYFYDFIYCLARSYYVNALDEPVYALLPIDTFKSNEDIDKEDLNEYIRDIRFAPVREYGDDYVEYDEYSISVADDISKSLEAMLLNLDDMENISVDNPFGENIEDEEFEDDIEFAEDEEKSDEDKYEFDDVDPEIFKDPTLLVKWLNKDRYKNEK